MSNVALQCPRCQRIHYWIRPEGTSVSREDLCVICADVGQVAILRHCVEQLQEVRTGRWKAVARFTNGHGGYRQEWVVLEGYGLPMGAFGYGPTHYVTAAELEADAKNRSEWLLANKKQ